MFEKEFAKIPPERRQKVANMINYRVEEQVRFHMKDLRNEVNKMLST